MSPHSILQSHFGHRDFRGQQLAVIQHVLEGGHALVIMPTGMGKSLCYQIPALIRARSRPLQNADQRPAVTLVLSPLIALMKDQVDGLRDRGIAASYINSSLRRHEREQRYAAVRRGEYALLYVTPERFRKAEFVEAIQQRRIELLAVDEAHCISEWGHDFRPDYTRLREFRELMGQPTTIALTATATPDVQRDIVRQLGLTEADVRLFHEGIDRPNLTLEVLDVWGDDEKLEHILRHRKSEPGSGIVYFTLIRTLMEFSDRLRGVGVAHLVYHGDLEREQRKRVQDRFMRQPNHLVLATNAFGMGVDKEDIRFVIHADVPGSMESYYQEIGRAGRDGIASQCVLLYDERDLMTQMEFVRWSNPDAEFYERVYDFLRHDLEQIRAYGFDWFRERLHHKNTHDHRLDTALAMLERHGVIDGAADPSELQVLDELSGSLRESNELGSKLRRDQEKLYTLVQYVKCTTDRKAFIHDYFGLPYDATS